MPSQARSLCLADQKPVFFTLYSMVSLVGFKYIGIQNQWELIWGKVTWGYIYVKIHRAVYKDLCIYCMSLNKKKLNLHNMARPKIWSWTPTRALQSAAQIRVQGDEATAQSDPKPLLSILVTGPCQSESGFYPGQLLELGVAFGVLTNDSQNWEQHGELWDGTGNSLLTISLSWYKIDL